MIEKDVEAKTTTWQNALFNPVSHMNPYRGFTNSNWIDLSTTDWESKIGEHENIN